MELQVRVYILLCLLLLACVCAKHDAGDLEVKAPVAERQLQNAVALRQAYTAYNTHLSLWSRSKALQSTALIITT